MKRWEEIFDIASGNYGIITARQAKSVCSNADVELPRWAKIGRLDRRGYGVYKLVQYTPTPYDQFAEAVALAGENAFLHGESVLAINDLALVNPAVIHVASPRRTRRTLPDWIHVVPAAKDAKVDECFGIPCQRVVDAFRVCKGVVPITRLRKAVEDAAREGIVTPKEAHALRDELK